MPKGQDTRDHANRKVDREAILDRIIQQQTAMWGSINPADIAEHVSEVDEPSVQRSFVGKVLGPGSQYK
jgi:hypothetical protein